MTGNLSPTKCAVKSFFGFLGGGYLLSQGAVPEPPLQYWRLSIEDCRLKSRTGARGCETRDYFHHGDTEKRPFLFALWITNAESFCSVRRFFLERDLPFGCGYAALCLGASVVRRFFQNSFKASNARATNSLRAVSRIEKSRIQERGKRKFETGNWKLETGNWEVVASTSFHFLVSIFFPVQFPISSF